MSAYDVWFLARRPFVLPLKPYVRHKCVWEKFAYDMAGCTVCGVLHQCDALTCKHQETTEDSIVCVITGCHIGTLYANEVWNDRSVSCSLVTHHKKETTIDMETHVHDLILSSTAKRCLEYEQRKIMQHVICKLNNQILLENCQCALDVVSNIMKFTPSKISHSFCEIKRSAIKSRCLHAISESASILFNNSYLKICRSNHRHVIFGLIYLLRFGVKLHGRIILPQIVELNHILPQETNMKVFFDVNPCSITDTENKLKFVIRQQYYAGKA